MKQFIFLILSFFKRADIMCIYLAMPAKRQRRFFMMVASGNGILFWGDLMMIMMEVGAVPQILGRKQRGVRNQRGYEGQTIKYFFVHFLFALTLSLCLSLYISFNNIYT